VSSMTKGERRDADLFKQQPNRVQRVAKGSGYAPEAVAELVAKFVMMRDMMGNIGQQASFLQKIPGAQQLAMARKLKNMVKVQGEDQAIAQIAQEMLESAVAGGGGPGRGGFPGMPGGFPGMPGGMGGFPGMGDPNALMQALMGGGGMPGGPGQAAPKPRPTSLGVPKDKRKQERDARRKNRKK